MSRPTRHRRLLIEALEPRLLFSATADIAVFDDGYSDGQSLAQAAEQLDLVGIYMPDIPLMMESQDSDFDSDPQADVAPYTQPTATTLVFIDTGVAGYQTLVDDIRNRTDANSTAIIYLDATKGGIAQISNYLAGASGISAIHVISHGVAGNLQLGSQVLNENNIGQYAQQLTAWKTALGEDADILLYGCDVAANQSGINLLRQLSDLTGADIAASNDLTGTTVNADWNLEVQMGQIETASIFTSNQSIEWEGTLADVVHLYSGVATNEQIISIGGDVKQGVQLTTSETVDRVQVMLANYGTSSSSVQMIIHESTYNGAVVASASVDTSAITNTLGWVNFDFTQTTLNAYTVYWIEFKTDDGADNLVSIGYINSNVIVSEFVVNNAGDSSKDMAIALVDVENGAPTVANAIPNQSTDEESLYSYTFPANTFNDADGNTLTYTATLSNGNPLPPWLNFNAGTRTFSGVPDDGDVGTISIKVTANDGFGGTVDDTFDLTINNVNDLPFVNIPIPNQNATEDTAFNYSFPANTFGDGDVGTSFTYTAELADGSPLPGWLSFDSATRTFSGTPANDDVGTLSVKVIANDGGGATVSDNFDIAVANTNDAPTVANQIPNQTATENALYNYTFPINTFNDQDVGNTFTYTAQLPGGTPLPAWLTFDGATRTFSGTPSNGDVGNITIEVIANDGTTTVSDFFDLQVDNVGATNVNYESSGPAADAQSLSSGVPLYQSFTHDSVGATYTIDSVILQIKKDPSASVQTITVSLIASTYNGAVVASNTKSSAGLNTALSWEAFDFSGVALNDNQIYFIKVETTSFDGLVSVGIHNTNVYPNGSYHSSTGTPDPDRDLAFQVSSGINNNPNIANPISNQNATEDAAYNFQFAANTFSDADGDTLTYNATMADGSALPVWLNFDAATRTFSGTPANADVGTISIKVTADDTKGGTPETDTFDLVIANTNDAPTVANPIANQNATEDAAFNFTFAVNTFNDVDLGNTLTYSAQLAGGGALPAWLSFDSATRTFSGTPTNAFVGTVSIDVIANDGNGGTVTDTFNIVVANTNDAPTVANVIPNQNATEDVAFNFQFAANTFNDVDVGNTLIYSAQLAGGGALPAWLSFDALTRTFSGTPTNDFVGTVSIDVIASDGNGGTVTDTFDISVANTNDAPTVSIAVDDYYADEQVAINLHGTGISVADVDGDALTVTLTGAGSNSNLAATVGTTGVVIVSGVNTNTLILTGTAAQLNDLFSGNNGSTLTYRLSGDTPVATRLLTISASDGSLSGNDTATINITAVNDGPENDVPGAQATDEDTALVFSSANGNQIQVDDLDVVAGDLEVTLSVTNGTLTLAGTIGLTFTTGDGTADTSLVFRGTQDDINDALNGLTFNPTTNYSGSALLTITTSDLGNTGTGGTLTDSDNINITINAANDAPTVANVIPNQNASENSAFNFQFAANTFTDVDVGNTLTYAAQLAGGGALPAWLSFDAVTRTFSGGPTTADVGSVDIDVIASDGNGGSVTDTFTITVASLGDTEYIDTGNGGAQIPVSSANQVGQSFSYNSAGTTYTVNEISLYLARYDNAAPQTITVELRDAWNGAILASDSIPSSQISRDGFGWHSFNFANVALNDQQTYVIQISSTGTDDLVLVSRNAGNTFADGAMIENGVPDAAGWDLAFKISKEDGTNAAPVLDNPIADQTIDAELPFNLVVPANTFSDPDANDTITYRAQLAGGGSLDWLTFNEATRTFAGTPHWHQAGTMTVELIATDNHGASTSEFFDIEVTNTNTAPTVANPIPDQVTNEDAPFSFQFAANTFADVDVGNTFTYSAELAVLGGLPPWLGFDAATRTFSGTPANADVGTWTVEVTANDGFGGEVIDTFVITVDNTNDAPTLANPLADQNATENSAFNFQFATNTFNDQDLGDVFTYSAQLAGGGALPAWLNFDSATRTFSGTPVNANVGSVSIDVIADDGNGGTITDTFAIVVTNQLTNAAPTLQNAIADQTANEDSLFGFTVPANTFVDAEGDTLNYSAQLAGGGALPSWLSFDAATRTFSGTPTNDDVGTIAVLVSVSDGNGGSASDTVVIAVNNTNDAPVVVNPPTNQTAQENSPFIVSFGSNMFADVDANTTLIYSAQLANGDALPDWLVFDPATLSFSGTPTNTDTGNLSIQIIANDGLANTSAQFQLTVIPVNDAPVTSGFSPINNLEDAAGDTLDLFAAFSDAETAANQLQYVVVSNSNSTLVSGATIDATTGKLQLSYGANQFGSADLVIRAQDAQGARVETSLRVNIESVNDVPTSAGIADLRVQVGAAPQQMNLHNVFSDIEDGAQLQYSLMGNSNPAVATSVQIDPATGMMRLAFSSGTGGESIITLRALDAGGAWIDTHFKVTVTAADTGIVVPPIVPPVTPEEPAPPITPPTEPPIAEIPVTNPPVGGGSQVGDPLLPANPDDTIDTNLPGTGNTGSGDVITSDDDRAEFTVVNDQSSRDYARATEMLNSGNVPLATLTASTSLVSLIAPDAGFAPWEAEDFDNEVRRVRAQMDEAMEEEQDRNAVVAGLTFSVTTGLLVWSLRASSLLLTMMSMLPLWRGLDPLPILDEVNKKKKELEQQRKDRAREDKSAKEVGYLFDHAQNKKSQP